MKHVGEGLADFGKVRPAHEHARSPRQEIVGERGAAERADAPGRRLLAEDVADRLELLAHQAAYAVDDEVSPVDVLAQGARRHPRRARRDGEDDEPRARGDVGHVLGVPHAGRQLTVTRPT